MNEDIKVGDLVTPISDRCGLWLADTSINGDYYQKRNNVCVFKGVGKVLKINKTIIDYDEWSEQDRINGVGDFLSVGKLEVRDFLIECDAGTGWGDALKQIDAVCDELEVL